MSSSVPRRYIKPADLTYMSGRRGARMLSVDLLDEGSDVVFVSHLGRVIVGRKLLCRDIIVGPGTALVFRQAVSCRRLLAATDTAVAFTHIVATGRVVGASFAGASLTTRKTVHARSVRISEGISCIRLYLSGKLSGEAICPIGAR